MSIFATAPEKRERELIPAGSHPAYLYRIVYLGTQKKEFEGKEVQSQKIWMDFEFPNLIEEYDDKETKEKKKFARSIGAEYTLSLSDRGKLLPLIQGWIGRNLTSDELHSFDVCSLLGNPAFVSVSHNVAKNGNTYANIASVSPVIQGYQMPKMFNQPLEIGKAEWGTDYFDELPKFLQEKIMESNEWKLLTQPVQQPIHEQIQPEKIVGGGQYRVAEVPEIPTIKLDV